MALAHEISAYGRSTQGNTALALPQVEPGPRSVRRATAVAAKRSRRGVVIMGLVAWLCVMSAAMLLVWRNSLVLEEGARITKQREQLALLDQANKELENKLVTASSVQAVEAWAAAHGMTRPLVVKALKPDAAAVAVKPAPEETAAEAAPVDDSLWGAVKSMVTGSGVFAFFAGK